MPGGTEEQMDGRMEGGRHREKKKGRQGDREGGIKSKREDVMEKGKKEEHDNLFSAI